MLQPRDVNDMSSYPEPVVISPKSGEHRHTFILLRGRGSNGQDFATDLLSTPISASNSNTTLPFLFPDAKFIFPTASRRRAQAFNRSAINQWSDLWDLKNARVRRDLQYEGLRQSRQYLLSLLQSACEEVGSSNVVV